MTNEKPDLPKFPHPSDPDYLEKRRERARLHAKWKNSTPEGKAAAKARKEKYRSKPGVREHERKKAREYAAKVGREQRRAWAFKHHHGVTRADADAMAEAQGGVCKVCGCPPTGKGHHSRLHVDHCHETGKIRGMLCPQCNIALGCAKDSPETLEKLAAYLRSSS